ncbi:MAG: type IV secretory system conjugative DNA transfer family protein [Synergistaceae bacterium]|jgi:type IV secretion system protein VirD4|nr:type IV secretory system conjugative DNA transfer family protein [Synergistaceae bacterium]
MATDSFGSARWADEKDLAGENFQFFADLSHSQHGNPGDKSNFYLLGMLADPKKLLSGIQQNYEPSLGALFSGLTDLFKRAAGAKNLNFSRRYLGWAGNGHLITVAPTRSGKGVGLVIPNLLNYGGSVIVIDPKGENFAVTADYRKKILGQTIVKLDPFDMCKNAKASVINPLDLLNPSSPDILDDVNTIVDALVVREKDEKDPHWNDKARSMIKGMVLAILCGEHSSRRIHLGEARKLLTSSFEDFVRLSQNMASHTDKANGLLSRAGNEILAMLGTSELSGVISTALRHTEFLDSPRVMSSLCDEKNGDRGDYMLRNIKTKGNVSIYIILPPHLIARYSRLMRLWVGSAMAVMTRNQSKAPGPPVLFMLDEMAQLGRMEQLIQAVSLQAGYGLSMWMILQDIGQLKSLYPNEWSSFLANARIQQYFGINDPETAKYVSEMLGSATISVESSSTSKSKSGKMTDLLQQTTKAESIQKSEKERRLLMVDELRRLDRKVLITLVQGCPPLLAEKIEYFSDSNFLNIATRNPFV